jgi:alkylation response protein AidB-like acyl-CoA dehydrogenase
VSPARLPDLDLGEEANAFRQEVRAFLDENWPVAMRHEHFPGMDQAINRDFTHALAERGWLGVSWPRVWGGQERGAFEQLAFVEEMEYANAPTRAHGMAVSIVGPALMTHGSDAQRQRHLPAILRGDLCVCLGYSEPDAGSDLASLRTRARRDGDDWIIDGAKLYTTMADVADVCWLAARSEPDAGKHAGISVFLMPMSAQGITVRPLQTMNGGKTNAVFFDSVRIPGDSLVGAPGGGWAIITEALAFERIMLGGKVARVRSEFDQLADHLRETMHDGRRLAEDPRVRDRLGGLAAELEAARMLALRCVSLVAEGKVPHHEASMTKVYTSELEERLADAALDLLGVSATLSAEAPDPVLGGLFEHLARFSVLDFFGGGTNDIQRSLIAVRGMGLPR